MTPLTLIKRKFRRKWSDVQMLVLLELVTCPQCYQMLMETTKVSHGGLWNALRVLHEAGLIGKRLRHGRTVLFLTGPGSEEMRKFFEES